MRLTLQTFPCCQDGVRLVASYEGQQVLDICSSAVGPDMQLLAIDTGEVWSAHSKPADPNDLSEWWETQPQEVKDTVTELRRLLRLTKLTNARLQREETTELSEARRDLRVLIHRTKQVRAAVRVERERLSALVDVIGQHRVAYQALADESERLHR